jgi:hypothetical protein
MLTFSWNFLAVKASPGVSSRHLILVDFKGLKHINMAEVLEQYYKWLPLGDFIKVVDLDGRKRSSWQERTSAPMDQSFMDVLHPKFRFSNHLHNKYSEEFSVLLIVGNCNNVPANLGELFVSTEQMSNNQSTFCVFLPFACSNHLHEFGYMPSNIFGDYFAPATLSICMRDCIKRQATLRVKSVHIAL